MSIIFLGEGWLLCFVVTAISFLHYAPIEEIVFFCFQMVSNSIDQLLYSLCYNREIRRVKEGHPKWAISHPTPKGGEKKSFFLQKILLLSPFLSLHMIFWQFNLGIFLRSRLSTLPENWKYPSGIFFRFSFFSSFPYCILGL